MTTKRDARQRFRRKPAEPSFFNRREVRQAIYQIALVIGLVAFSTRSSHNAAENLRRQNIVSGTDFLGRVSGFDISQTLIEYANTSTYGRAFMVGLVEYAFWSRAVGIVLATILGFTAGIARLSSNWLVAQNRDALCRSRAQLPAAPAIVPLVLRCSENLASACSSRKLWRISSCMQTARGRRARSNCRVACCCNNRGLIMPKPEFLRDQALCCGAYWLHSARDRVPLGAPSADGNRPAVPGLLASLALIIRLAHHRVLSDRPPDLA